MCSRKTYSAFQHLLLDVNSQRHLVSSVKSVTENLGEEINKQGILRIPEQIA